MAAGQIAKPQISDSNPNETFHLEPNRFEHPANLPVDTLMKNNAQPGRRNGAQLRNLGALPVEKNSAQQIRRERRVPWPIERHFVFLVDLVTRMGQSLGQSAVVCENDKPFALRIESANIGEPRKFGRQQIENSVARVWIVFGGNKTDRFMQHEVKGWCDVDELAIDFDVIALARLSAEICARLAVDGDPAGGD